MIRLRDIEKRYDGLQVLGGLTLDIADNKTTVLLGPSGCGKTTLLNILAGLDRNFSGNISGLKKSARVSFCFQEDRLLDWMDVHSNVRFVLDDSQAAEKRIDHYLGMMELLPYARFRSDKLSGGMRQRTAIARALAYRSNILLMDEPFRSLDHTLKRNLFGKFAGDFRSEKRTVVIVTHDPNDALMLADTVYILSEKPASVLKKMELRIPKEERTLPGKAMHGLKKELLEWI